MVHPLILLSYLFHYGRTQLLSQAAGTVPLLVRSPNLNCWSSNADYGTDTNATVAAFCGYYNNWNVHEDHYVCY